MGERVYTYILYINMSEKRLPNIVFILNLWTKHIDKSNMRFRVLNLSSFHLHMFAKRSPNFFLEISVEAPILFRSVLLS